MGVEVDPGLNREASPQRAPALRAASRFHAMKTALLTNTPALDRWGPAGIVSLSANSAPEGEPSAGAAPDPDKGRNLTALREALREGRLAGARQQAENAAARLKVLRMLSALGLPGNARQAALLASQTGAAAREYLAALPEGEDAYAERHAAVAVRMRTALSDAALIVGRQGRLQDFWSWRRLEAGDLRRTVSVASEDVEALARRILEARSKAAAPAPSRASGRASLGPNARGG